MEIYELIAIITGLNFAFALLRTYLNWRTLKESREYWKSWRRRRKDVARDVLKELTTEQLERELARRKGRRRRRK